MSNHGLSENSLGVPLGYGRPESPFCPKGLVHKARNAVRNVDLRHGKGMSMSTQKKTVVTRDYRVTVIVEEIEAPKLNDAPNSKEFWKDEVDDFLDEADYSRG